MKKHAMPSCRGCYISITLRITMGKALVREYFVVSGGGRRSNGNPRSFGELTETFFHFGDESETVHPRLTVDFDPS